MIKDLEEYINGIASRQATRRLLEGCKKIDQFAKAMEPFFKITDLLVSSHPEWSAIAWGAIRLVFQVRMFTHYEYAMKSTYFKPGLIIIER